MTTTLIVLVAASIAVAIWFAVRFGQLLADDGYGHNQPPRHVS